MATRGVIERITAARCESVRTGQGILAPKLIERVIAFALCPVVLRDGEDCLCTRCRRNLSFCLSDFHLDAAWRGVAGTTPSGVFPAKRLFGEIISFVLIVPAGSGVERIVVNKPQMPRPNDCAALGDSNHGIAIFNGCGRHFELHEGIIAGIVHNLGGAKLHQSGFICPNHLGMS